MDGDQQVERTLRPDPPVPCDADLRIFPWMPIAISRLRTSVFAVKVSAEAFRAALMLWLNAWHEVPASSLPNDDAVLAALAGLGRGEAALAEWHRLKPEALYGWYEASDGRLYHDVLAELAAKSLHLKRTESRTKAKNAEKQKRYRDRSKAAEGSPGANELSSRNRNGDGDEDRNAHGWRTGNVTPLKGSELEEKGQEEEQEKTGPVSSPLVKAAPNYTRDFEAFWGAYPKPVSKPAALAAYVEAVKALGVEGISIILAGATRYRDICGKQNTKFEFMPAPARWLSERRWEDVHENIPFHFRGSNRNPGAFPTRELPQITSVPTKNVEAPKPPEDEFDPDDF